MNLSELKLRLRAILRPRQTQRDIDDEVAFHLAMNPQHRPDPLFGNPTRTAEALRDMHGWTVIEHLWQDLRIALRQLRLNPGFALGAVLPLALAVGCIGAVLTLADAVLFRPTGIRDPSRIAAVYTFSRTQNRYLSDSYPDFRDVRGLTGLIESAAGYIRSAFNVRLGGSGAELLNAELVTGDYFRTAGIAPVIGRPLTPADDRPGAPPVALASYSLWQNRYASSPSILGSVAWINGVPFTIVGVMPEGYRGMLLDWYADCSFWAPLAHFNRLFSGGLPDFENRRDAQMLMMFARLRPGVRLSRFQAALDVLAARVAARPDDRFVALASAAARFFPAYRAGTVRYLWLLLTVCLAAVAIACFNLASLLLARASARRQELATRIAVGAGRARLLQQFLIENSVLALCACALSLPVALVVTVWLAGAPITDGFRLTLDMRPDSRALSLGMLAGFATALLTGLIPAWRASRGSIAPSLKSTRTGRVSWSEVFVAAQIACAMTVLVPAGMLVQSLRDLRAQPLGYDAQGVLLGTLDLNGGGVRTPAAVDRVGRALLADLRSQAPAAALASSALPTNMRAFQYVRTAAESAAPWKPLAFDWISDGFFELLRTPVANGRSILPSDDRLAAPVAVINQAAANLLWPGENPVGRHLEFRQGDPDREIVGVVQDSRFRPLGAPHSAEPCVFLPLFQKLGPTALDIHVRTPGPPLQFAAALRRIAQQDAPNASLSGIRTLQDQGEEGLKSMGLAEQATAAASLLGILLALAGVFASSAYRVALQRKEVAIRVAIGAKPARVVAAYACRGLWIGLAGACIGALPAAWGVSFLRSTVTAVGVPNLAIFTAAVAALALFSAAAALAAARRIARLDPAGVLRLQ